jgi:hypothetical protein
MTVYPIRSLDRNCSSLNQILSISVADYLHLIRDQKVRLSKMGLGVFGFNAKGILRFDVETACRNTSTPIRCGILFNSSDIETRIGQFRRKEFEPNPDIAGIGVSTTFSPFLFRDFLEIF